MDIGSHKDIPDSIVYTLNCLVIIVSISSCVPVDQDVCFFFGCTMSVGDSKASKNYFRNEQGSQGRNMQVVGPTLVSGEERILIGQDRILAR